MSKSIVSAFDFFKLLRYKHEKGTFMTDSLLPILLFGKSITYKNVAKQ